MTGPGQPTDPAGGTPNQEPAPTPPAAPPPATPPSASDATGATPPPASESVTPPPPPAAPSTPPASASGDRSNEEKPPEWVAQAQNWRPAEVAAGPAPGIAYADLTTRIIAYIIDAIILGIGFGIVSGVIFTGLLFGLGFVGFFVITAVIYAVASAVYFIYTWLNLRASPGQKILNLQTVNEKDGATLTQNQAITRWAYLFGPAVVAQALSFGPYGGFGFGGAAAIGSLISLVVFGYYIYLIYTTANDPKRQGFHDKQSGTVVVKTTPAA